MQSFAKLRAEILAGGLLLAAMSSQLCAQEASPRADDDLTFEVDGNRRVTGLRIYADGKVAGTFELAPRIGDISPRSQEN